MGKLANLVKFQNSFILILILKAILKFDPDKL